MKIASTRNLEEYLARQKLTWKCIPGFLQHRKRFWKKQLLFELFALRFWELLLDLLPFLRKNPNPFAPFAPFAFLRVRCCLGRWRDHLDGGSPRLIFLESALASESSPQKIPGIFQTTSIIFDTSIFYFYFLHFGNGGSSDHRLRYNRIPHGKNHGAADKKTRTRPEEAVTKGDRGLSNFTKIWCGLQTKPAQSLDGCGQADHKDLDMPWRRAKQARSR